MNDDNEIEMVWVEFVGGPLDGQCRNLPRVQTHLNVALPIPEHSTPYGEDVVYREVGFVTYKIECSWRKGPGYNRESFKGVLV